MFVKYFKSRSKHYIFVFLGLLIGAIISKILIDELNYPLILSVFLIGFLLGELITINKWSKENNN